MPKSKYDGYEVAMCQIIKTMYEEKPNIVQRRVEIRYRWLDRYPHHNVATNNNRGTKARVHIQNTLKDLEDRGVLIRLFESGMIRILDLTRLNEIANWQRDDED